MKLGFHKSSNTYYAIKLAKKQRNSLNERSLTNEFFLLKELKHPHLIRLFDFSPSADYKKKNGKMQTSMYTVLELAQGGPLFDYLAFTGKFSEETARVYFSQLLSGLFSFFINETKKIYNITLIHKLYIVKSLTLFALKWNMPSRFKARKFAFE